MKSHRSASPRRIERRGARRRLLVVADRHRPRRRPKCIADVDRASPATITVFAAASLKVDLHRTGHPVSRRTTPEQRSRSTSPGSSDLVTQLTQGAPADVFASADTKNMTKAVDAGLVTGDPVNFATNTLTIVTATGKPERHRLLCGSGQARHHRSWCAHPRCPADPRPRRSKRPPA